MACFSKTCSYKVRFQVLTAASLKMAVFWVVAPRSLVEVYRRFRGACYLHLHGDLIFYQTAWRNSPEDSHLLFIQSFSPKPSGKETTWET
jgi:hypothetical protein